MRYFLRLFWTINFKKQKINYMKTIQIIPFLLIAITISLKSQDIPYGVNETAGRYCNVGDANIYYEVYGEGFPVVLLHGGFGYIDSFKKYISALSKKFKVIAIAQRGYGKSEIGSKQFSHTLCADDVKAVIQKESMGKAIIIGFSSGANIGYLTAYKYPEIVEKFIAMSGALNMSDGERYEAKSLSGTFEYYRPEFKKIMPQPERWNELMENIAIMWNEPAILPISELQKIECPVLLLFGDRDESCKLEHIAEIYKRLPNAQLAIIPNSKHLDVSPRNTKILDDYILPFIDNP